MRKLLAAAAITAGVLVPVVAPAHAAQVPSSRDTTCVDSWHFWCGTYSQHVDPTVHWWQPGLWGWMHG